MRWLRESSLSPFVSNLLDKISITKLRAMFYRAGRIVDIFLPKDRLSGTARGLAFVRFASPVEAERAIEMATSKSWGGRRIHVNLARFQANKMEGTGRKTEVQEAIKGPYGRVVAGVGSSSTWGNKGGISKKSVAGWLVEEGEEKGVSVAPWVVVEEKHLVCSIVGSLVGGGEGLHKIEGWVEKNWGKKPICIKRLKERSMLIQLCSAKEVNQFPWVAREKIPGSTFNAMD